MVLGCGVHIMRAVVRVKRSARISASLACRLVENRINNQLKVYERLVSLRDFLVTYAPQSLALGGLLIGCALGAIVFKTSFCAMGSLSDIAAFGDYRRLRAWLLASATAILGVQGLALAQVVGIDRSMYLAPSLNWTGNLVGGAMFGFGMVFAGGCATRNLTRAGGGDLRSLLTVIVLGLAAYITLGGLLGPLRDGLERASAIILPTPTQSLVDIAAAMAGSPAAPTRIAVTALVAGAMLAYCFADAKFRRSPTHIASGLGVGLCVVAGWALTGLAFDELARKPIAPHSLTFVRPAGDTLDWMTRATALGLPGFGVTSVIGTIAGAFLVAVTSGRFRLATFSDTGDTLRHLAGACLMGIGGVMALGCTVGQAITGVSTLAVGSFLTFGSIVAGGFVGLRTLERLLMRDA